MSEKRFILDMMRNPSRILKDGKVMSKYDVVKLLNKLNDENEQLRFELEECQNNKLYSRRELEKENEQLRQTLKRVCNTACDECDEKWCEK